MNAVVTPQPANVSQMRPTKQRLWRLWATGTGIAAILVIVAFQAAKQVADPLVVSGTGEVTLGNTIAMTIIGATVGAAVAYGIGRFTQRPRRVFVAATLIALAGYAVVPFTAAESVGTAVWLNVFHVVVAVPVTVALTRYLPSERVSAGA
jgi:uncharacterized membrane protein